MEGLADLAKSAPLLGAVVFKLCSLESPGGLVKTEIVRPHP